MVRDSFRPKPKLLIAKFRDEMIAFCIVDHPTFGRFGDGMRALNPWAGHGFSLLQSRSLRWPTHEPFTPRWAQL
jgi:hypothetical protein